MYGRRGTVTTRRTVAYSKIVVSHVIVVRRRVQTRARKIGVWFSFQLSLQPRILWGYANLRRAMIWRVKSRAIRIVLGCTESFTFGEMSGKCIFYTAYRFSHYFIQIMRCKCGRRARERNNEGKKKKRACGNGRGSTINTRRYFYAV